MCEKLAEVSVCLLIKFKLNTIYTQISIYLYYFVFSRILTDLPVFYMGSFECVW